jgi:hypothetical protein
MEQTIGLAEKLCELLPGQLSLSLEAGRVCARGLEQKLLPSLSIDLAEEIVNPLPVRGPVVATRQAAS